MHADRFHGPPLIIQRIGRDNGNKVAFISCTAKNGKTGPDGCLVRPGPGQGNVQGGGNAAGRGRAGDAVRRHVHGGLDRGPYFMTAQFQSYSGQRFRPRHPIRLQPQGALNGFEFLIFFDNHIII